MSPYLRGRVASLSLYFQPLAEGTRFANLVIDSPQLESLAILLISGIRSDLSPQIVDVIEYYNAAQDHYFITALAQEIQRWTMAWLAGWKRTGDSFKAYFAANDGFSPVCRFYIPAGYGDSHFYSASPAECADALAKYPSFIQESANVFYIGLPDGDDGCLPGRDESGLSRLEWAASTPITVTPPVRRSSIKCARWAGSSRVTVPVLTTRSCARRNDRYAVPAIHSLIASANSALTSGSLLPVRAGT